MFLRKVPPEEAIGHLLCHHQTDASGRRVLKKGKVVEPADAETLRALGKSAVFVAVLEPDDVLENDAARALGEALVRPNLTTGGASTGRVNLIASAPGLFKVDTAALTQLNSLPGIALATLSTNTPVEARRYVATLKIIPYAVPAADLERALAVCEAATVIDLVPFTLKRVSLVTVGNPSAPEKVRESFAPALRDRIEGLYGVLEEGPHVAEDDEDLAGALQETLDRGAEMVLIAGETSIVDGDDIIPRAIRAAGGDVVQYGVPVEPGNMLLLAYRGRVPIVGTPGCARSKATNVVDLVLRRLMARERLGREDLIEFAHGGYLV